MIRQNIIRIVFFLISILFFSNSYSQEKFDSVKIYSVGYSTEIGISVDIPYVIAVGDSMSIKNKLQIIKIYNKIINLIDFKKSIDRTKMIFAPRIVFIFFYRDIKKIICFSAEGSQLVTIDKDYFRTKPIYLDKYFKGFKKIRKLICCL